MKNNNNENVSKQTLTRGFANKYLSRIKFNLNLRISKDNLLRISKSTDIFINININVLKHRYTTQVTHVSKHSS